MQQKQTNETKTNKYLKKLEEDEFLKNLEKADKRAGTLIRSVRVELEKLSNDGKLNPAGEYTLGKIFGNSEKSFEHIKKAADAKITWTYLGAIISAKIRLLQAYNQALDISFNGKIEYDVSEEKFDHYGIKHGIKKFDVAAYAKLLKDINLYYREECYYSRVKALNAFRCILSDENKKPFITRMRHRPLVTQLRKIDTEIKKEGIQKIEDSLYKEGVLDKGNVSTVFECELEKTKKIVSHYQDQSDIIIQSMSKLEYLANVYVDWISKELINGFKDISDTIIRIEMDVYVDWIPRNLIDDFKKIMEKMKKKEGNVVRDDMKQKF